GTPTLAFLASGWEGLKVRLTAKGADRDAACEVLDEWDRRVRGLVGDIVFGVDDETMESVVLDALRRRGLTLGLAESVTGGLVGARLTGVAGPTEQDGVAVGTLWAGIAGLGPTTARAFRLPGQREQMRQFAVITALDLLRRSLGTTGVAPIG
ncbi:MAG TPA: CinA family protein, partial [Ilumatobacteraceae bacterium]